MTAIAMNVLLQQLHKIVPAFNVASVPKDSTGAYASPVHIIAGLLDKTPSYIQKIINGICVNVDANCTKMKVIVNGTEQRNRIMVGNAESILRILASCNRQEMAVIVASASQAPSVAEAPHAPSVAPTPQAPFVAEAPQVPVAPAPQVPVEPASAHIQQIKKPLVLNGMVIEVDPVTSMVNATQMCLAGGKLFGDYYRQKSTEEYLQTLSSSMGIHIFDLVRTKPGHNRGTMVHFQVALHVAYWLSSEVQVQFSKWIGPVEPEPAHLQQIKKPLVLNGMVIEVDPVTFMVNATQMCRAAGKMFGHYRELKSTEDFLQTLSFNIGISILKLIESNPGGDHSGTMVHFQVALHVAYWLSSEVQVQFSKWIGELLLTGRVELGKEKTPEELDAIWKSRVAEEQAKIQADYLREKLSKDLYLLRNKKLFVFLFCFYLCFYFVFICVFILYLFVFYLTGARIYFKNKNDSDSNERVATTTA